MRVIVLLIAILLIGSAPLVSAAPCDEGRPPEPGGNRRCNYE